MVSGAADLEERRMERKDGSGITFISSSFLHVQFSNRTSKPLGRSIEGLKKQPTPREVINSMSSDQAGCSKPLSES